MASPSTQHEIAFAPLNNSRQMAEMIAELTNQTVEAVLDRLREELKDPGGSIARDLTRRGLVPYVWSDQLIEFYGATDGFLYELALWNRNKVKRRMRKWLRRFLDAYTSEKFDILGYGDGLGFDSLDLHRAGHRVTYFEVPGLTQRFASLLFERSGASIPVLTDPKNIPENSVDVVVCLDVLEHVPDPGAMVSELVSYLRPGGLLAVHAPFYMIHPYYATHLKANRRLAGSISLYTGAGLEWIDSHFGWNPLIFRKPGGPPRQSMNPFKRAGLGAIGGMLSLGRIGLLPLGLIHHYRRRGNQWFDD